MEESYPHSATSSASPAPRSADLEIHDSLFYFAFTDTFDVTVIAVLWQELCRNFLRLSVFVGRAGKDVIGLAQTGSGKTGAFALPILQVFPCTHVMRTFRVKVWGRNSSRLLQLRSTRGALNMQRLQELLDKPQPFFALVLSPTRELAIQIAGQFEALGSTIGVRCAALVGGIDMMQQAIALGKRPHILVGTPGRVVDHLSNTKVMLRSHPMITSVTFTCLYMEGATSK